MSKVNLAGHPLGKAHGVQDRQPHVGNGDLRQDAAVHELHQRMDCGLRMYRDPDSGGRQVEQAAGFDDLQALIEQGGGIDGDPAAHDPGGMAQGLLHGDVLKLVRWKLAEGAAGSGQPDAANFRCGSRRAGTGGSRCVRNRWATGGHCALRASRVRISPAATMASLLARPTAFPAATAA